MANFKHDDEQSRVARFSQKGAPQCGECEALLADVLDGTLADDEQEQFDLHLTTCNACARMLADAQRGAAWLEMLRTPRPEPPTALLERILAQTSGQTSTRQSSLVSASLSSLNPSDAEDQADHSPRLGKVLPFRSRFTAAFQRNAIGHVVLQPRLAMTAAMAFFSIGLTLNLTGVRLNEFRLANLKPANLRRSFYQADAHIVRYYTNLRVVYELESRVRDLQRATESEPADPESKPADDPKATPGQQKSRPMPGQGTSRRQGIFRAPQSVAALSHGDALYLVKPASGCQTIASTQLHRIAQEGDLV